MILKTDLKSGQIIKLIKLWSYKGRMVNALGIGDDEGRDYLR